MTNEPGILRRRSRAAMRELLQRMRELEAQGLDRKTIAQRLGATPAQVTNGLGPKKAWRNRRCALQLP